MNLALTEAVCVTGRMDQEDSAPPGWEGSVEQMKSHPEIDNPFALANWMAGQGYHPHDAMHADVLDMAHEMFRAVGHDGSEYCADETEGPEEDEEEPSEE